MAFCVLPSENFEYMMNGGAGLAERG